MYVTRSFPLLSKTQAKAVASTMADEEGEEEDLVLDRWAATESTENRGPAARRAAATVWRRFRDEILRSGDTDIAALPESRVYEWLTMVQSDPMWHSGRRNRLLPHRVVRAALEHAGYPRIHNILPVVTRHMTRMNLIQWWPDLVRLRPHNHAANASLLWRAYCVETERTGYARAVKVRRERRRRWVRWVRTHTRASEWTDTDQPVDAGLPPLFTDPRFVDRVDPYVRFFAPLLWPDDATAVLNFFRALHDHIRRTAATNPRRAAILAAYIRPFFRICVALTAQPPTWSLMQRLDTCHRSDVVAAMSAVSRHHTPRRVPDLGRCIKAVFQFTHGPWSALLPSWSGWMAVRRQEVGYHPPKRRRARDRFTDEEVDRLRRIARAAHPADHALLLFYPPLRRIHAARRCNFLHTGCRSGAACSLRVDDVVDPDTHAIRSDACVLEKGGERRHFTIDHELATALRSAINMNRGSAYVFPNVRGVGRRPPSQNDAWLRSLCSRCDPPIHGAHVHVHALRRTTISMLIASTSTRQKKDRWDVGAPRWMREIHSSRSADGSDTILPPSQTSTGRRTPPP